VPVLARDCVCVCVALWRAFLACFVMVPVLEPVPRWTVHDEPTVWYSPWGEGNTLWFLESFWRCLLSEADFPSPRATFPFSLPRFPHHPANASWPSYWRGHVSSLQESRLWFPGAGSSCHKIREKPWNSVVIFMYIDQIYIKENLRFVPASSCMPKTVSTKKKSAQIQFSWVCAALNYSSYFCYLDDCSAD
jgi:hypothetical protein